MDPPLLLLPLLAVQTHQPPPLIYVPGRGQQVIIHHYYWWIYSTGQRKWCWILDMCIFILFLLLKYFYSGVLCVFYLLFTFLGNERGLLCTLYSFSKWGDEYLAACGAMLMATKAWSPHSWLLGCWRLRVEKYWNMETSLYKGTPDICSPTWMSMGNIVHFVTQDKCK